MRNPLNRPMRTRTSGGVAGESGRPLPLCRLANSACGDFESSAQKIDGIRTAIRIFGYEEDSSFCVGLMHVTSKVMRGFVNHCIEELVLTSGAIRPKTLCNQTGDCG